MASGPHDKRLAKAVRGLRLAHRPPLSQGELAEKALGPGEDYNKVQRLEGAKARLGIETAALIEWALKVPVGTIAFEAGYVDMAGVLSHHALEVIRSDLPLEARTYAVQQIEEVVRILGRLQHLLPEPAKLHFGD